jgi:hypothetical protein
MVRCLWADGVQNWRNESPMAWRKYFRTAPETIFDAEKHKPFHMALVVSFAQNETFLTFFLAFKPPRPSYCPPVKCKDLNSYQISLCLQPQKDEFLRVNLVGIQSKEMTGLTSCKSPSHQRSEASKSPQNSSQRSFTIDGLPGQPVGSRRRK